MCPRCAGKVFRGFDLSKKSNKLKNRAKQRLPGRTNPASTPALPEDTVTKSSFQSILKDLTLWRHLCDFLDAYELSQLHTSSRLCLTSLRSLDWKLHYERQRQKSKDDFLYECFPDEPDVFVLMPGMDCPSSWRELFFSCLQKRKWLQSISSRISGEASFGLGVLEFLKSASLSTKVFGEERIFSQNDVFIVNLKDILIDQLNAELIEFFLNTTYRSVTCTLSSGTVAIMRECGLPDSKTTVLMCTLYPFQSESDSVSYADLAEVICHRKLISSGGYSRPRIRAFAAAATTVIMPYEIYGVHFHVSACAYLDCWKITQ